MTGAAGRPLDGVLVLDLSQYEAGPTCTLTLAQLGARVIKIERPASGEAGRTAGSQASATEGSAMWAMFNVNKESVVLDVASPAGAAVLMRLVEHADVLVENFRPGVAERLGLTADRLRAVNPRLIYASITGFTRHSPWEEYAAFDPVIQAMGGITAATGEPGGIPVRAGVNVVDTASGWQASIAILAALLQRTATGLGSTVEVSMHATAINLCRPLFGVIAGGMIPARSGNDSPVPGPVPAGLFRCWPHGPNDYLSVFLPPGDKPWAAFIAALARPALLQSDRFATAELRYLRRNEIESELEEWLGERDKSQAMRELAEAGIPVGAVLSVQDLLADPWLTELGELSHSVEHGAAILRPPLPAFALDGNPPVTTLPAPHLGRDTERVLLELLGMTTAEAEQLRAT